MQKSATFRIYTENKNPEEIKRIMLKHFKGFTMYQAQGFWRLQKENTLVIEVLGQTEIVEKINAAAKEIKERNDREAVLVQQIPNNHWLI